MMNRFKEFRRDKRMRLTPSKPKEGKTNVFIWILLYIFCFVFYVRRNVAQKSPGITEGLMEPTPMPGEDKVSYERHLKTLQ